MPPYGANIAFREFANFRGVLSLAFELRTCPSDFIAFLMKAALAINYLGKRGSFIQYAGASRLKELDSTFTTPVRDAGSSAPGQRATLDDFGLKASFAALNLFSPTEVRRDIDRRFVETLVPLQIHNSGPGFIEYRAAGKPL